MIMMIKTGLQNGNGKFFLSNFSAVFCKNSDSDGFFAQNRYTVCIMSSSSFDYSFSASVFHFFNETKSFSDQISLQFSVKAPIPTDFLHKNDLNKLDTIIQSYKTESFSNQILLQSPVKAPIPTVFLHKNNSNKLDTVHAFIQNLS